MHLIILTQYFLPEMGAPQNRLFELALGLKERGWRVSVVTAMPNYPTGKIFKAYTGKFTSIEEISGIEVKRYWLFPSNSKNLFPRIISMLSFSFTSLFSIRFIRKRKPEYLLVESPPLTLGMSALVLSRAASSRLILNVSDIWPLSALELGAISKGFIYRSLEKFEHFLYRNASLCLGQSQEIVDHIKLNKHNRVHLFRNGVDNSRFQIFENRILRNRIVYLGLLGVAQGLFQICKSVNFKELGCELHIYGAGPELDLIKAYLTSVPDRGIKYMGVVERNMVPEILSTYGGALVPLVKNIYGAVPSKVYEVMAAGLPVLFSGVGEGAKIISQFKAGWVSEPCNWNTLKLHIGHLLTMNDAEYSEMRNRNRQTASLNFHRGHMIDQLCSVLTDSKI